ncbi:glycosyltransferase family A protein [Ruegeria sp. HKCCA5491]|uniref:glycosyltransferase family 2 protein n=1 Tax=Ruegeria sp. HKCCA5491 TaxID=2682986 RepID=UPI0014893724|nr:glycosyltransferase family A protein [Ruegeria sp. HKCCA5491]
MNIDQAPLEYVAVFDVVPGQIYEIKLAVQRTDGENEGKLTTSAVELRFFDRFGCRVGHDATCKQSGQLGGDPLQIETLPAGDFGDDVYTAALATRIILAPSDAVRMELHPLAKEIVLRRSHLSASGVLWSSNDADRALEFAQERFPERLGQLKTNFLLERDTAALIVNSPQAQISALKSKYMPNEAWKDFFLRFSETSEQSDFELRMKHLRSEVTNLSRIGFIGSGRGYERLFGVSKVFWLREASYVEQLTYLNLDLIIVETSSSSEPGNDETDWALAFSSLDGALPERGAAFLAAAKAADVPVHLWVTTYPEAAGVWTECASAVDKVVVESGSNEDWEALGAPFVRVRRATEPAACTLASLYRRDPGRILCPAASDAFQKSDFADLIAAPLPGETALAEFHYGFTRGALDTRLGGRYLKVVGEHNRAMQRQMLQASGVVLLPAESVRADSMLESLAIDAIASGAIPVLFGEPRSDSALLTSLDKIFGPLDFMELLGRYSCEWERERRWRGLMRDIVRNHVWNSEERGALLGQDPFPEGFDTPLVSSILVTKRPHLLKQCLETFRKQTWPNKELILIFNSTSIPEDLPEMNENEQLFAMPEAANIGECLNRGIEYSSGRYWVKMDDDDFYSATYIEETVAYFRSTQSEVVGRQSAYFYFDGEGQTFARSIVFDRCFRLQSMRGHVSGATLSADKARVSSRFSMKYRNSNDSEWIGGLIKAGVRVFSGDSTSMVVYRDADVKKHTWMAKDLQVEVLCGGNLFDRLEEKA